MTGCSASQAPSGAAPETAPAVPGPTATGARQPAALVLEELARGDMGIAVSLMAPAAVATAIASYGDADQQATYLPAFTGDNPPAAALAFQEPQPLFDPSELRTVATTEGSDLVLHGVKALVPAADTAAAALAGGGAADLLVQLRVALRAAEEVRRGLVGAQGEVVVVDVEKRGVSVLQAVRSPLRVMLEPRLGLECRHLYTFRSRL